MNPAIFISHGAPNLALSDAPARRFLEGLGASLERPRAVLVASAHWETARPVVNRVEVNETIHDFRGFGPVMQAMRWPATGSSWLASRVVERLAEVGIPCDVDEQRGLDHGAWVPLSLVWPAHDVPVVQVSIQPDAGPGHHLALGQALRPLREEGVLLLGSGSFTHDLSEVRLGGGAPDQEPPWVSAFATWMDEAITQGRRGDLVAYRETAPFAVKNHPTEEHLLPLFVAMGGGGRAQRLHSSATYGVLRMDAYAFH